jgi:hypothetical protein
MSKVMGFQGEAFIGTAGSTAATRLTNSRDLGYTFDNETGETTVRGNSDAPPMFSEAVTKRVAGGTIQMVHDTTDTALETMRVAAYAGTAIALRIKDRAAGKGYDGDINVKNISEPKPLNGEQIIEVTWTPNNSHDREPQPYV